MLTCSGSVCNTMKPMQNSHGLCTFFISHPWCPWSAATSSRSHYVPQVSPRSRYRPAGVPQIPLPSRRRPPDPVTVPQRRPVLWRLQHRLCSGHYHSGRSRQEKITHEIVCCPAWCAAESGLFGGRDHSRSIWVAWWTTGW